MFCEWSDRQELTDRLETHLCFYDIQILYMFMRCQTNPISHQKSARLDGNVFIHSVAQPRHRWSHVISSLHFPTLTRNTLNRAFIVYDFKARPAHSIQINHADSPVHGNNSWHNFRGASGRQRDDLQYRVVYAQKTGEETQVLLF